MTQTEQLMLASIRACAATVDELVAAMAALPAQLTRQLEEVRQGVAVALREQAEATAKAFGVCEALRADMAELGGAVTARLDAAEQVQAETRQIIADNQAHASEQAKDFALGLDGVREDMAKAAAATDEAIDKVNTQLVESLTVTNSRVKSHAEELFELHALVPKVKTELAEQVASVQLLVEDMQAKVVEANVELARATDVNLQAIGTRIDVIEVENSGNFNAIAAVNSRIDEASAANAKELATLGSRIDDVDSVHTKGLADAVARVTGHVNDRFTTVVEQAKTVEDDLRGSIASEFTALSQRVDDMAAEAGDRFAALADADTELRQGVQAAREVAASNLTAAIGEVNQSVTKFFENASGQIADVAEEQKKAVGECKKAIDEAVTPLFDEVLTVREDVGVLRNAMDVRLESYRELIEQNSGAIQDLTKTTGDNIVAVEGRVTQVSDAVNELIVATNTDVAKYVEELRTADTETREGIEDVKVAIGELNQLTAVHTTVIEAVRESVSAVRTHVEAQLVGVREAVTAVRTDADKVLDEQSTKIDTLFTGAVEKANSVATHLDSYMEGIDERFAEVLAKHGGLADENKALTLAVGELRDATKADVKVEIDKLLKAMEDIPVGISPEDLAELQVRNAHTVDAQIGTALAGMKVDLRYDDGKVTLEAVMPRHDGTESRSVVDIPIEIGMRYREVWLENESYRPGDVVTHKGSMWVAKTNTAGEPGNDITGWTLAVKRGNHGRDGFSIEVHETHKEGTLYHKGDFLRWGNRLWQAKKEGRKAPDLSETASTDTWSLIGSLQ